MGSFDKLPRGTHGAGYSRQNLIELATIDQGEIAPLLADRDKNLDLEFAQASSDIQKSQEECCMMHSTADLRCIQCHVNHMTLDAPWDAPNQNKSLALPFGGRIDEHGLIFKCEWGTCFRKCTSLTTPPRDSRPRCRPGQPATFARETFSSSGTARILALLSFASLNSGREWGSEIFYFEIFI